MQPEEATLVQAPLRLHEGRMTCLACIQACSIVVAQGVTLGIRKQKHKAHTCSGLPEWWRLPKASLGPGHATSACSLAIKVEEPLLWGSGAPV